MSPTSSRGRFLTCVILAFLLGFTVLSVSHAAGDAGKSATLATVTRMLGFEPHPSTIDVPGPLMLQGKPFTAAIELLETWDADRAVPVIRKLGFKLKLFSNGSEAEVVELPAQPIEAKSLKKGTVFASGTGKAVGLKVTPSNRPEKARTFPPSPSISPSPRPARNRNRPPHLPLCRQRMPQPSRSRHRFPRAMTRPSSAWPEPSSPAPMPCPQPPSPERRCCIAKLFPRFRPSWTRRMSPF